MPTPIETEVLDVSVEFDPPNSDIQIITLKLKYTGQQEVEGQIEAGKLLDIELPSHAPPPTP